MTEAAYTAKDITVLEGLEPVRLRPGMYIGSTGSRGLHHLVYEVVDNAVDEALAGRNDLVDVTIHPDNSVTVRDAGAGIPGRPHRRPGAACADGRAHEASRRREVRRRRLQGVGRPARRRRLRRQRALRVARGGSAPRRKGVPPGVCARRADHEGRDDRRRAQGRVGHDDLVPSRLGGLRGDRAGRRDASPAPARDGLPDAWAAHRPSRRASRRPHGRVPLRGWDPRLRRSCQRVQGPGAQAHRVLRGRERRRAGRGRDAVEQLVRRVGVLVREQHQHDGGRHAPVRASRAR